MYHNLKADVLNGEKNGLEIILNAEQFSYAYHDTRAAGFKISLHHHQDKPMMQFSSQLIYPGTETHINLKPSVTYTTDDAISKFKPEERGCYADGEVNLTYLSYKYGYRYQMNNCLIDQAIRDIIWNCQCMPYFENNNPEYLEFIPLCSGLMIICAKKKM